LQLIDRLEPDKGRQGKLLTEHLAGHKVLPSTEEELAQILEQRAKKEAERQMATEEATMQRTSADHLVAEPHRSCMQISWQPLAAEPRRQHWQPEPHIMDRALEAEEKATGDAEATLSTASAMRE
jgi:hypothetical protein